MLLTDICPAQLSDTISENLSARSKITHRYGNPAQKSKNKKQVKSTKNKLEDPAMDYIIQNMWLNSNADAT